MKHLFKAIYISLGLLIGSFALAQTQNLGDLIDSLGTEITFGYNNNIKISVQTILTNKIAINTPIIKNQAGTNITKYTVMYSEYPLADILEKTDLLNQTKEKAFEMTGTTTPYTMELGTGDGIDPSKKYYLFVIPKDSNGTLGEVSNEIRFQLNTQAYGDGNSGTGTTTTDTTTHNAAGADMSLANITHTINGNMITLKWTAVDGSTNIDLSLLDKNSNTFNRIATVRMADETFAYTANANGEYTFKFAPDNGGRQVNYTVSMSRATTDRTVIKQTQGITKVPRTGPKENIMIIIGVALVGYYLYKRKFKKAK